MFNKINIKYLAISFFVLLALVVIVTPEKNNTKNRSFKSEIVEFDTSNATLIAIYPKGRDDLVSLEKKDGKWFVSDAQGSYNADNNQVKNMLATLAGLKAKRMAARGKDQWAKYELTDSLATRVQVLGGKKELADVYIGKFSYQQPPQSANPYMQRQQGIMTSFVRLKGEKDVFAVDGFLSMNFNRQVSDLRDRTLAHFSKDKLSRLSCITPAGNFDLIKQDSIWTLGGIIADSASVASYISGLSYLNSNNFIAEKNKPLNQPSHILTIEAADLSQALKLYGYYTDSTNIAVSSSVNPGTFFDGTKSELFNKIFKSKESFIK
ncbi:MAG: DUF4340 domain-containing protein [Bacteroidales bacterium]|nr:DUF4340 domain-containing protein [Bacteroidales bacterium]MBN2818957.1 DUF4340 domain-containing protein [Bacteroidales bacterium]